MSWKLKSTETNLVIPEKGNLYISRRDLKGSKVLYLCMWYIEAGGSQQGAIRSTCQETLCIAPALQTPSRRGRCNQERGYGEPTGKAHPTSPDNRTTGQHWAFQLFPIIIAVDYMAEECYPKNPTLLTSATPESRDKMLELQ